ncbi:MAG: hypothetical protein FJ296_02730 [Planctomycetes bacterium]|nr:hypothetical protein [Planctomycetota bacterium]
MPPAAAELARLNLLNIALMLGSAALACALPFELFLAACAVLGPLHYLTQVSWLHDCGFFTTGPRDWLPLALLALLALDALWTRWVPWRGAAFLALVAGRVHAWEPANVFFAGLLPTVIHAYVITGLFLVAGNLRSRSASGWASVAIFLACGAALLLVRPEGGRPSDRALPRLGPSTACWTRRRGWSATARRRSWPWGAACLRLHVPRPQLVLEDARHRLARGWPRARDGDRRAVAGVGGPVRPGLRRGPAGAVRAGHGARVPRVPAGRPDAGVRRLRVAPAGPHCGLVARGC